MFFVFLLVMKVMLAGHAGDVENDADDKPKPKITRKQIESRPAMNARLSHGHILTHFGTQMCLFLQKDNQGGGFFRQVQ